jgi:hypothetical protein
MAETWTHLSIDWCDGTSWQGSDAQTSLDAMLNSQGELGWELVAAVGLQTPGCVRYLLKRASE